MDRYSKRYCIEYSMNRFLGIILHKKHAYTACHKARLFTRSTRSRAGRWPVYRLAVSNIRRVQLIL